MSKVISVDVSMVNGKIKYYGIIFNKGSIEKFLLTSDDYKIKDFVEIVLSNTDSSPTIILDENGLGVQLLDYFLELRHTNTYDLMSLDLTTMRTIGSYLSEAKENLLDLAINSIMDSASRIEFKKLVRELDNLEVNVLGNGIVRVNNKDKNIDKTRAICYLMYFAKFMKSLT